METFLFVLYKYLSFDFGRIRNLNLSVFPAAVWQKDTQNAGSQYEPFSSRTKQFKWERIYIFRDAEGDSECLKVGGRWQITTRFHYIE